MTIDYRRVALIALLPALAACEHNYPGPPASKFGDANRATLAAQVVDPDPQYETINPPTSGEKAGQAGEKGQCSDRQQRNDQQRRPCLLHRRAGPLASPATSPGRGARVHRMRHNAAASTASLSPSSP